MLSDAPESHDGISVCVLVFDDVLVKLGSCETTEVVSVVVGVGAFEPPLIGLLQKFCASR
jgi:hypothetical protein